MRCPNCGADDDRVIDSRPSRTGDSIRRRRACSACGDRFTTFERIESPPLLVEKRSGARVAFERGRVVDGMARAAKGRAEPATLEDAAAAVERSLRDLGQRVVTSEQVGLLVLAQLRDLDPVAYVRFASVYKDFQGPEDFETELSSLAKDAPPKW